MMQESKLILLKKKILTMTVVICWNKLSQEVVEAPALDMFKTHLDKA